jgi:hypothetical protein
LSRNANSGTICVSSRLAAVFVTLVEFRDAG